ncbi:hypothetical protein WH52_09865 [Tenacibaculum holothuriorum]|uniref:Uncharacterized protein n=1 Tax=Tenacibaculum holothuriorum TaxID=1635173 RepID=A0A1Y2PB74_9FLAO|nr:hypothetical protein [Tenacibaculum holothuriorum]OSY87726.1 hypothetical protein WH52_09865 [Tenacibaculum holothuriorum]
MPKNIKHIKPFILTCALALFLFSKASAQQVRVIDNKGTIQSVNNNNVTSSNTAPTNPIEGDVWFDTNSSPTTIKIWDEQFGPSGDWRNLSDAIGEWKLSGNSGTNSSTNFLGTTDAQDLVLRAGNVEKLRITNDRGQVRINQAPVFNNHPLVIRANGDDVLAFQDNTGTPRWHWNLLSNGLNFVESNVLDFRLFLENGGNVGINTNDPTERLDVNGKLRVRDITTVITNNEILTTDSNGVVEKKALVATETNNQITTGANGGIYLGPTVFTGSFTISAPVGTNDTTTFLQTIPGLPFQPSQITFVAHPNIESLEPDTDANNGVGNNTATLQNTFGTMNGFANNSSGTLTQATMFVGGSGTSINNISRYSSNDYCIGIRYTDQNARDLGKIRASLNSFNASGFILSVTYNIGAAGTGNLAFRRQIFNEDLVVFYTAYK